MGLLDLVDKLFPAQGVDGSKFFVPVDAQKLANDLSLEKRGKQAGSRGEPPASQTAYDAVEIQITAEFSERWQQASARYHEHVAQYKRRMDLAIDMAGNVEDVALSSGGDFDAISKVASLHLFNQRQLVADMDEEYRTFREDNRLKRTAVPRGSRVLNIGILLAAVVAESVLNGAFLAHIFGGALLIAFLFAVGISVINVLASLLLGIFSRYVQHVAPVKRLLGLVAIAAFLAWAAGYNLFVANFRDAAEGLEWEEALIASVRNFIEAPWTLDNFQSWMLALLGGLISAVVFIKGVFWDDFYPGFGSLSRRRAQANEDYADMATQALADIRKVRDESAEELQIARERLIVGLSETTLILTEQSSLAMQYATHHQHLEDGANYALGVYRAANRRSRPDDAPPPEHFDSRHRLPEPQKVAGTEHVAVEAGKLKSKFDAALEKARTAIAEAYEASLRQIESLKDVTGVGGPGPDPGGKA